jgi:hypothetical protein
VAESSIALPPEIGAQAMPQYRLYRLSPDDHIVGISNVVESDSDEDVIAHAKSKLDGLGIEIWDGPRLVTRLKASE